MYPSNSIVRKSVVAGCAVAGAGKLGCINIGIGMVLNYVCVLSVPVVVVDVVVGRWGT